MDSLSNALTYPMESDDWVRTVLIGGVLTIFGFLLIPAILVYGYLVRVIRDRLEGGSEPPGFDDWGEMFVDGVQAFVIGIVYMIVPLIVAGVTVGGSIAAMATGTRGGAAAGIAGMIGGLTISFVLSLAFGYVALAAVVNFAREGEFGAAFDVGTLRTIVLSGDYAVAWLLSVGVLIVASVVVGVLNVVPFLGFIVGSFAFFYADIVAADLIAGGFADALGPETDAGGADPGGTPV